MSKLQYTALSPEQALERALGERNDVVTRPQRTPRQVLGMWMENAGVGVGVGAVAGVGLYALGAPESMWIGGAAGTGVVVWGLLMALRGSADERAARSSERQVKRALKALEQEYAGRTARLEAKLEQALDALDEADQVEAQLRKSLDEMARQRDRAVYDLTREREQGGQRNSGKTNFVTPVELAPDDVRDATALILHYYEVGEHLSRRKAVENRRWSERQWDAAKKHLDAAGVIRIVRGQTEYPQTLDEALATFGEYLLHSLQLSVPTINKTVGRALYVESENE